jgi:hypothetical protein
MPSYLTHERMNCEVTFVKRVTADDPTDALNASWDGDSELIGVVIGDALAGGEHEEVHPDQPHFIPPGMYPEESRK